MAVITKLLARTVLTTTNTTVLYTVPNSSTTTTITNIVVSNSTASAASFNLTIPDATGTQVQIATAVTVGANSVAFFDLKQVLGGTGTQTIVGWASTSSALAIHISGVEIS
jgi:hypothetical protein